MIHQSRQVRFVLGSRGIVDFPEVGSFQITPALSRSVYRLRSDHGASANYPAIRRANRLMRGIIGSYSDGDRASSRVLTPTPLAEPALTRI